MLRTPRALWGFLLLVLAGTARSAPPRLAGRYTSEGLGELEFTTREGRVHARHLAGGGCPYRSDEEVVTGEFEGNVLVGTLAVCQRGASCQARSYPMLAFYHPDDGSLSAHVRLESGCTSPALQEGVLRLTPLQGSAAVTEDALQQAC
jgi:hypothetical protein